MILKVKDENGQWQEVVFKSYSTFVNAINLKPITDASTIPNNSLFMDNSGILKFKNINGTIKTINMS